MDEMALSLTSVQRPSRDGPIYPAPHRGLRGAIFSLPRFIYSLSLYLSLLPSLLKQSAWHSLVVRLSPSVFSSLSLFPSDLSARDVISGGDGWEEKHSMSSERHLTRFSPLAQTKETQRDWAVIKIKKKQPSQKMNRIRLDLWHIPWCDGERWSQGTMFGAAMQYCAKGQRILCWFVQCHKNIHVLGHYQG